MRILVLAVLGCCLSAAGGPAPSPVHRFDGIAADEQFGFSVGCCDVNRDKFGDIIVGARFADPAGMSDAGSVFVYSGKTGALLMRKDGLAAGDEFGWSVACCDVNRDKFADIIVGAPFATANGMSFAGSVFVYSGKNGALLMRKDGLAAGDGFGSSLACCDVNRDRFPDLIVGALFADPGGMPEAGSVFVYSGKTGALLMRKDGLAAGDEFGWSVACCDVNRDKFSDLIVGAPLADPNEMSFAGTVYVYSGKDGTLLMQKDGLAAMDEFAHAISCCDVNRDRFPDLVIDAPLADPDGASNAGSVYVYSGKDGTLLMQRDGLAAGDAFGRSLACCDVNRDKFGDIIAGAGFADPGGVSNAGSVFVYSGRDFSLLRRLDGLAEGDGFGFSVACCDVNRDRFGDVVVGAPLADPGGMTRAGSVFVYSGREVSTAGR